MSWTAATRSGSMSQIAAQVVGASSSIRSAIANGFVFVSGQSFVEGADIEAQTRGVLDKVASLLEDAGTDLAHAVRCTVYMSDLSLRDRMSAVYRQYFPA